VGVAIGASSTLLFRRETVLKRRHHPNRLRAYYQSAKESLDDFVETELNDLRRAIKRRRRKLGL